MSDGEDRQDISTRERVQGAALVLVGLIGLVYGAALWTGAVTQTLPWFVYTTLSIILFAYGWFHFWNE
jgi:hypothetical protein